MSASPLRRGTRFLNAAIHNLRAGRYEDARIQLANADKAFEEGGLSKNVFVRTVMRIAWKFASKLPPDRMFFNFRGNPAGRNVVWPEI